MSDASEPVADPGVVPFDEFLGGFEDITFEDAPVEPEFVEPPLEDIPTGFEDATVSIGDGSCIVCGAPTFRPPGLTKAGHKKRVPKYCDLHTRNSRTPYDGPDAAHLESQLQRIQEELADDIRLLATMAGPMFPVTGYYLFDKADPFTTAVLKLAKNNTRVLRVLHRAAQVAPVYTVAETVAGTAYAFQVDTHKASPHTTVGRRLGVSRVYDIIYPENVQEEQGNLRTNGSNAPPRYAGVQ